MPELPEVETIVRDLNKKVLNRTFIDVWSDTKKLVKKPKNFESFKKEIKNKKILKIWRRAKNIIFDLSDGYILLIHLKMTGHLLFGEWQIESGGWKPVHKGPLQDPYNRFLHLVLFFDDGKKLALSDARKFAKVELWKTDELLDSKEFKELGPEPLDSGFALVKFKEIIRGKKGRIKQLLMNQNVIAGIGNIYSSEILWWAKIHPERSVASLSEKEIELLYEAIIKVLKIGIKLGGESFSDYRKPDGSKGDFDSERKVYKREGQKCSRCGTPIKRLKVSQRSAFYCSHCQKL